MYIIENLKTIGKLLRANQAANGSNAQISINTSEDILIKDCDFNMKGYNCIEIALKTGCMPKNITIQNCNFSADLDNNTISIFDTAPDAVIKIKNCHFSHSSNPIRLSARSNNSCTVYIEDCTCDYWETNPVYAGFILLQDYTSKEFTEENLNKFKNINIIVSNLKVPTAYPMKDADGKFVFTKLQDVCSTCEYKSQFMYMYRDHAKPAFIEYNKEFPTLVLK